MFWLSASGRRSADELLQPNQNGYFLRVFPPRFSFFLHFHGEDDLSGCEAPAGFFRHGGSGQVGFGFAERRFVQPLLFLRPGLRSLLLLPSMLHFLHIFDNVLHRPFLTPPPAGRVGIPLQWKLFFVVTAMMLRRMVTVGGI